MSRKARRARFEGYEPVEELASAIIDGTVFNRTELHAADGDPEEGDSYSVAASLQEHADERQPEGAGRQDAGLGYGGHPGPARSGRPADGYAAQTDCVIGRELVYPTFIRQGRRAFTLPGHSDPEGTARLDPLRQCVRWRRDVGELMTAQNTVDNLIAAGPCAGGSARARSSRCWSRRPPRARPTAGQQTTCGWPGIKPIAGNVAWPVKSVAYRCRWPVDSQTPKIVLASELGSEIGGQPVLSTKQYVDPTVYHQIDHELPGYSPNHEHALLAASNLGNPQPAFVCAAHRPVQPEYQRAGLPLLCAAEVPRCAAGQPHPDGCVPGRS